MKKVSSWEDWHERYSRFPGVQHCVELLKLRNTQGELVDTICGVLEKNAPEQIEELLAAAESDDNLAVRLMLLGVIQNANLPAAIPFWARRLASGDETDRIYAVGALKQLNTRESRQVLWEAGEK